MRNWWLAALAVLLFACGSDNGGTGDITADGGDVATDGGDVTTRPEDGGGDDTPPVDDLEVMEDEDVVLPTGDFESFTLAPDGDLRAVWGHAGRLVAVGDGGVILRKQGSHWTPMASPTQQDLLAVFGLADDDVWAAGTQGTLLHWDGTAWMPVDPGVEGLEDVALRGIWGAEDHLYVVGDLGWVLHFTGGKWKKEDTLSTYTLAGIWGSSLMDIYVSAAGGAILRKIGGAWSLTQVTQGTVQLNDVFAWSSKDLWAVGTAGALVVHGASGWSPKQSNDAYKRALHGVWAFSDTDVWLIGEEGALIQKQGDKWNTAPIEGPYYKNHSFYGLWGVPGDGETPDQAWAVGQQGAVLHFDGEAWRDEASAPIVDIDDIVGDGWEDVVAVGGDGLLLRFDGERWVGLPRLTDASLHAVTVYQDRFLAVGESGAVVLVDDATPAAPANEIQTALHGVCARGDTAAAVGEQGKLYTTGDGENWLPTSTGVFDTLRDCAIDADGTITAVGDMGRIVAVSGGQAESVPVATIANLHRLAAAPDGTLFAVGDNGLIMRRNGDGWEKIHEEPGLFLYGIHAFDDRVVAVGWAGRILIYFPETGEVEHIQAEQAGVLLQVWGMDPNHLFVVGKKGNMLRLVNEQAE